VLKENILIPDFFLIRQEKERMKNKRKLRDDKGLISLFLFLDLEEKIKKKNKK
jgi:hypothetical protein